MKYQKIINLLKMKMKILSLLDLEHEIGLK